MNEPSHIDVNADRLLIEWPDGGKNEYPAPYLRGLCQCANCVSEVTGELLLNRKTISPELKITAAEPMGNYAVSVAFSDFHKTGIYSYEYLRKMAR